MGAYSAIELAEKLGLPRPTDQQARIIEAPPSPMLVIAGAGSGKTETMAARVVWLVANGLVRPQEVLGLTFTRKASGELNARLRGRLSQLSAAGLVDLAGEPTVSTYHAYAARIVAEHGLRAGLEPTMRLLSPAVCWQMVDSVVATYDGEMSDVDSAPITVTEHILALTGELAEHVRGVEELRTWTTDLCERIEQLPAGSTRGQPAVVRKLLARQRARLQLVPLLEEYERRKRGIEAMDFADQLRVAALLARDHPEVAAVERARYRVVLLDEYQDTSYAQLVLLRSVFSAGFPVTAVGDPSQSIYGWRGASVSNMARFSRDFPDRSGGMARVAPLSVSWRNAGRILQLANAVSAPLRENSHVDVPELAPRPGVEDSGEVIAARLPTVDDEAEWIADRVHRAWLGPQTPTTAVLVRKRNQIDRIATALRARNIPVEIVGLGGLLSTPEVRDVVSFLTVIADPAAGHALLRLLTGPRCNLGPRDLAALASRSHELAAAASEETPSVDQHGPPVLRREAELNKASVIEALDDLGNPRRYSAAGFARLCRLRDDVRRLRARFAEPIPDLVADAEHLLGLDVEVVVHRAEGARVNLDAFADVAQRFAAEAEHPTLSAFLAFLRAAEQREYGLPSGEIEVRDDAVQILTVHAAKGLEWDVVAVAGLVSGVFPAEKRDRPLWTGKLGVLPFPLRGDTADLPELDLSSVMDQVGVAGALEDFVEHWDEHALAEERRLAYVAFTRARHTLLCSGYWFDDGATKTRSPSVFLEEVHQHCQTAGEIDQWAERPDEEQRSPLATQPRTAHWPAVSSLQRHDDLTQAAELVRATQNANTTDILDAQIADMGNVSPPNADAAESVPSDVGEQWVSEARLLLAERAARSEQGVVRLPDKLSVSSLVTLHKGAQELARAIRRPMPRPPAPYAQRGTVFHAWLEQRFGAQRLLDLDALPGAGDAETAPDPDLMALQEAFGESEWAHLAPFDVEVAFATVIEGVVIRGRIDAVFRTRTNDGHRYEVVDWKTGTRPSGEAAQAASVQLAAYRLAWSQLVGAPIENVSAAFHYVRENHTERPVDLLDEAGLTALITQLPTG